MKCKGDVMRFVKGKNPMHKRDHVLRHKSKL